MPYMAAAVIIPDHRRNAVFISNDWWMGCAGSRFWNHRRICTDRHVPANVQHGEIIPWEAGTKGGEEQVAERFEPDRRSLRTIISWMFSQADVPFEAVL